MFLSLFSTLVVGTATITGGAIAVIPVIGSTIVATTVSAGAIAGAAAKMLKEGSIN